MSKIVKFIQYFLENQKTDYLEKKIAQKTRDKKKNLDLLLQKSDSNISVDKLELEKMKYAEAVAKARTEFEPEAENKYELITWLNKAYSKVKPNVTTHPAKFTNPRISNATNLLFYGSEITDGYVKTGSSRLFSKVDVSGDAATNTIIFELYSLLAMQLENGEALISLFEIDDADLKDFFKSISIEYESMKAKCLEVYYGKASAPSTHEQIKQVYFPVGNENKEYHLLSVVTPSMLMFEAKNRVDAFDKWINGQHVRQLKKDNKYYSEGFDEVLGITAIGFSPEEFTKMGNFSYLNVRNKGISYLLPSVPPKLHKRDTRLPRTNFFKNTLSPKKYQDSFQILNRLIKTGVNNVHIRDKINNTLKYLIDQVLQQVFRVRAMGDGWSNAEYYQSLPQAQRIWLDDAHIERREAEEDWLKEITHDAARWILNTYQFVCKDSFIKLSDDELREVKKMVAEAISKDREFFK